MWCSLSVHLCVCVCVCVCVCLGHRYSACIIFVCVAIVLHKSNSIPDDGCTCMMLLRHTRTSNELLYMGNPVAVFELTFEAP
jgi:hypothetical protein